MGKTPTYRGVSGRPRGRAPAFPQDPEQGGVRTNIRKKPKHTSGPHQVSKLHPGDTGPRDAETSTGHHAEWTVEVVGALA